MKKITNFLNNILSSSNEASSKRLVLIITVISIILMCFLNMFFHLNIAEFMFSGLVTIVMVSLGAVGVENVTNNISKNKKQNEEKTDS